MNVPDGLRYTKEHEWILLDSDGKTATIGITDYAQESLGDITFIELPAAGDEIKASETFGVVESVKAVSDLFAPVSGAVVDVNSPLLETPEMVNEDPYGEAWMIKVEVKDIPESDLMDAETYKKHVEDKI